LQHTLYLPEREAEILEGHDAVEARELGDRIVAVPRDAIHRDGREQADLVIVA